MYFSYTYSERYITVVDVLIIMLNMSSRSFLSKVLVSFSISIFTIYFFKCKKIIKFNNNRVLCDLDARWVAVHQILDKRNIKKITKKMLVKMLLTVNISKGFARWKEMAESLNPEMEKVGVKLIWAGTNQEKSKIFKIVHMVDASQIKTFGERPDIFKARTEVGTVVASTTVISNTGED